LVLAVHVLIKRLYYWPVVHGSFSLTSISLYFKKHWEMKLA